MLKKLIGTVIVVSFGAAAVALAAGPYRRVPSVEERLETLIKDQVAKSIKVEIKGRVTSFCGGHDGYVVVEIKTVSAGKALGEDGALRVVEKTEHLKTLVISEKSLKMAFTPDRLKNVEVMEASACLAD